MPSIGKRSYSSHVSLILSAIIAVSFILVSPPGISVASTHSPLFQYIVRAVLLEIN